MNSRAITLIATIAVIGIVAVGAGYAYTAITVNDNNSAAAKYVTLSQNDYSFSDNVAEYFDSITYMDRSGNSPTEVTAYKISATQSTDSISVTDHKVVKLGSVTITPQAHGYATYADLPAGSLTVTSTGFTTGTNLHYYLVDASGVIKYETSNGTTWTAANGGAALVEKTVADQSTATTGSDYENIVLNLCYGYATSAEITQGTGTGYIAEAPQNLGNPTAQTPVYGVITFTLTVNEPSS